MVKQTKEKIMKFKKIEDNLRWRETPRLYEVWEREDDPKVVITKMRRTSDYVVENLKTHKIFFVDTLKEAKEIGYTL